MPPPVRKGNRFGEKPTAFAAALPRSLAARLGGLVSLALGSFGGLAEKDGKARRLVALRPLGRARPATCECYRKQQRRHVGISVGSGRVAHNQQTQITVYVKTHRES